MRGVKPFSAGSAEVKGKMLLPKVAIKERGLKLAKVAIKEGESYAGDGLPYQHS